MNPEDSQSWLMKPDGSVIPVVPSNGTDFSLEELQAFVGGYAQIVILNDGRIAVCNEDGKYMGLPFNKAANAIWGNPHDKLVGDVLICPSHMVK